MIVNYGKPKLGFNDVLIEPRPTSIKSRSEVNLERTFNFKSGSWTGVPIVAANMDTIGTFEMAQQLYKHKILTCIHKYYSVDNWHKAILAYSFLHSTKPLQYIAVSSGVDTYELEKVDILLKAYPLIKFICLDVANGYMEKFADTVKTVRQKHPDKIIIAGNVATPDGVDYLKYAGADIVKIGLGSGSVCTTRKITGVGYPQISAIDECSKNDCYIMSDGGCTTPGDIAKAFVAGADFVMLGGMLAAHYECGTTSYYGMSSQEAMDKHNCSSKKTPEGKIVKLKSRGPVNNTILQILGGLRSAGSYISCKNIEDYSLMANLIHVTEQTNNVYGEE